MRPHLAILALYLAGSTGPLASPSLAAPGRATGTSHAFDTAVRDTLRRIDANRINLFVTNIGSFAWDLFTGNGGLIWPKGTNKSAVFASGLWLGCRVGGEIRTAVTYYESEYGPGPMVGASPADPALPVHRTYKVARWTGNPADSAHVERTAAELAADPLLDPLLHHSWSEYLAGAAPYGAPTRVYRLPVTATPVAGDSVDVTGPDVKGDQMLWAVYNDADPSRHASDLRTLPLGVEVQQTTCEWNTDDALSNTVFLEFRIVNKGGNRLDSTYVTLWSDPDLGDSADDLVGCDSSRALGFCYNALSSDGVYGVPPPAVGYVLLEGPRGDTGDRLGMTAFTGRYDPGSAEEGYNMMKGLQRSGTPWIDPVTGAPSRFLFSGDPVTGQGWLDSNPYDRRFMLSSGPFTMAPGDTQTVLVAIVVGQGMDRLASVGVVRCLADRARAAFLAGLPPNPAPAAPCPPHVATSCPRTAEFWAAECALGGALIAPADLARIARFVGEQSTLFAWPAGEEQARFCATVDPPGRSTCARSHGASSRRCSPTTRRAGSGSGPRTASRCS